MTIHALAFVAALALPQPSPEPTPNPPAGTQPAQPAVAPTPSAVTSTPAAAKPVPSVGLGDDYTPPFDSDELKLSQVLTEAASTNLDLQIDALDIEVSEAQILAATGAYDVFINASLGGSYSELPQRGSQLVFNFGSRSISGSIGFQRELETGGSISLNIDASREITTQLSGFFPGAPVVDLNTYRVTPTLQISHPLLKGAGLKIGRADINKAKIAKTQAEAGMQATAQDLARDLISAYWDVLFAHRDLENKRRSVELAQNQLTRTQALVRAGRQSPVDAKAVEQSLASRESEVLTSENSLLDASLTLRTLMGQEFADRDVLGVLPATDPVVRPRNVVVRDEIERALAANPSVRQLELALASSRIDELVAANQRLPQLDVSGSFTPQGRSIDTVPDTTTGDAGGRGSWGEAFRNIFNEDVTDDGLLADWTVSGSVTLVWDVQNRGPKGNHEAAKAQIRQAQLNLKQVRQQTAASVIRAANSLRTASAQMDVAQISLDLAKENLAAEQARFDVGRSTNFDVLERLDELDASAASQLNAQISYLQALVTLQALTGEILPAYGLAP